MSTSRWACHSIPLVFAFALMTTTSACVTKGTYDKKVAELDKLRADHDHASADREKDLKAQIDRLQTQVSEADSLITALTAERDEMRRDAACANSFRRRSPLPASARSDAVPPRLAPPPKR